MDLAIGGPSWAGWKFAPFGRARDWRLHAPDGTTYDACEIAELRRMALDLDYLQVRCRDLETRVISTACYFTRTELELIASALAVLQRALPRAARQARRWRPGPPGRGSMPVAVRDLKPQKKGDTKVPGGVEIVAPRPSGTGDLRRRAMVPLRFGNQSTPPYPRLKPDKSELFAVTPPSNGLKPNRPRRAPRRVPAFVR